jgi:hypothetical protein
METCCKHAPGLARCLLAKVSIDKDLLHSRPKTFDVSGDAHAIEAHPA